MPLNLEGSQCADRAQVGPRLSFTTAWSANAASICASCGLGKVARIEPSRRLLFHTSGALAAEQQASLAAMVRSQALHDGLTSEQGTGCRLPGPAAFTGPECDGQGTLEQGWPLTWLREPGTICNCLRPSAMQSGPISRSRK